MYCYQKNRLIRHSVAWYFKISKNTNDKKLPNMNSLPSLFNFIQVIIFSAWELGFYCHIVLFASCENKAILIQLSYGSLGV